MALRHGDEYFTIWTHLENGKVMHRRLHRLEIQDRCGYLNILTGDEMPQYIQTSAGQGYKGAHSGQVLLAPETISRRPEYGLPDTWPWPLARDVLHMTLGLIGFLAIRFFLNVIAGSS